MLFFSKKFLFSLLVVLAVSTTSAQAENVPLNLAIVDINAVLGKALAPKSIREQVNAIKKKYRQEVQTEEEQLRKANQELAQKQALLSKEAFNEERRKFELKVREVQKAVQQKDQNLQSARLVAQNKVKEALRKVVLDIAQKKGFTLVLRREQTIVVADQLDITADVIESLNKQLPSIKVFSGK